MNENNIYKGRNCYEKNIDTNKNINQTGPAAQKIRQKLEEKKKEN